jgi:hypothetical protein
MSDQDSQKLEIPEGITETFQSKSVAFDNLSGAVPAFTKVDKCAAFKAEYTTQNEDVVLHFFPPDRPDGPELEKYWKVTFPQVLDAVAKAFFKAGPDRLYAEYVPELASWYLKAKGFKTLDTDTFIGGFLQNLDDALAPNKVVQL